MRDVLLTQKIIEIELLQLGIPYDALKEFSPSEVGEYLVVMEVITERMSEGMRQ